MTEIPNSVLRIVEDAEAHHRNDPKAATEEALMGVKALPDYTNLIDLLVYGCVRDLVYDARHKATVAIKRQANFYGGPAKVTGVSREVLESYQSVYDYRIGGTTLGELVNGPELSKLVQRQKKTIIGHQFNLGLLEWVVANVPEGCRVKEKIPEKRLREVFPQLVQDKREAI